MSLHSVFSPEAGIRSTIKAIEEARKKLSHAQEVGVLPTYDLCVKDLISQLGRVSTDIYNELLKKKLLDPDVIQHALFDSNNCSTIIHSALTMAMTLV